MAAYTPFPTFIDEVLSTADTNAYMIDNAAAIKTPPTDEYSANEVSNFSTSSNTTVGVWTYTITTHGGDVMLGFTGTGDSAFIDVLVDGTQLINAGQKGIMFMDGTASACSFLYMVTGLAAGSHTFTFRIETRTAGTATIFAGAGTAGSDLHPQFFVREIS